jgi:class 3 adenylate cyclase/tetratricopeptide (TPR) repeat protein
VTDLRRHVPQVALTWDEEVPGARWRVIDGTLVFADISGFTALTERLSKKGRIGAEEIVETLNRVFGGMLDTAAERGADLLKFGGDALLFLFRGEGHVERACDAAVEMRIALREAASVPTSVGRLRLGMSVGIHSGDIHLFLVGEPTRELVVLGPGATATADAEKAANAGEIIVTEGTASRLAGNATRPREDGALLLRRRLPAHPADGRPPAPEVDHERMRTLFPHALGEYLDPGPPDPEHRLATIAFARFAGTDSMLAEQGPDAVADAVHAIVTRAKECLDAEGITLLATDLGSDGSAFFLASGVPQSTEDDEGRMLRALRRFVDSDLPLPVQAGVNRGHVFVAEVGASSRAAFSAMGDTTNTAARIMSKATAGLLYAHPVVLEHSRTLFATTPAGPFAMKGKAVPLLVYDIGEEAGTREASDQGRLQLLGREEELAIVRDALIAAVDGAGGVVTVSGTTGMGKSRLVREALAGVDDVTVVTVRAEPYGAASSYRVFRDPLRQLLGVVRDTPDVMGRQLLETLEAAAPELLPMAPLIADVAQVEVPATPEADAIDPQYRPDRLADVLVQLVGTMLPGRLVLIAEEAHWADMASTHLLERIAAAAVARPWAVVSVRRGREGGFLPSSGVSVTLGPLPDDVVERLVIEATEAAPLRPHEVRAIVERAQGNPLFVEEAAKVARAAGSLDQMPGSLQAAMAAQIDLLDPTTRRILRYASVLGRSFRRRVLNQTLAADGLAIDPATIASLSEFLEADGRDRLRFRNTLLRDAAYEELAYRTRARLHRAAGVALERLSTDLEVDAPTLSLHFSRAGDDERTYRYALMAGEVARRSYANADAAAQFELALDAARRLDVPRQDLVEAWGVLGELRQLSGELDASVAAYRKAADLAAHDPVMQAELQALRARVHVRAGAYVTALRVVARARRLLEEADGSSVDRARVRLDNLSAVIRLGQERPKEARAWAMKAVDGARQTDDPVTLVQALIAIDHAELYLGMPVEGRYTAEALEICIANGYRPRESAARTNLGNFAFYAGRWDEALEWHESSRRVALEAGNAFGAAETDLSIGDPRQPRAARRSRGTGCATASAC